MSSNRVLICSVFLLQVLTTVLGFWSWGVDGVNKVEMTDAEATALTEAYGKIYKESPGIDQKRIAELNAAVTECIFKGLLNNTKNVTEMKDRVSEVVSEVINEQIKIVGDGGEKSKELQKRIEEKVNAFVSNHSSILSNLLGCHGNISKELMKEFNNGVKGEISPEIIMCGGKVANGGGLRAVGGGVLILFFVMGLVVNQIQ